MKKSLRGVVNLLRFLGTNLSECGAVASSFAIFNFCKVDGLIFDGNNVDFVSFGFIIVRDDVVTQSLEMFNDDVLSF